MAIPDDSWKPKNVILETSMGEIVVELYWKESPKTCKNFAELSRRGGDPTGTGKGGTSIYGSKFNDEISPALKHTGAGIMSMANAGPNTNGSQFFITLALTPHLDGKHTIFGRISAGMSVVEKLGKVKTDRNDRPLDNVKIVKASVK